MYKPAFGIIGRAIVRSPHTHKLDKITLDFGHTSTGGFTKCNDVVHEKLDILTLTQN